MTIHPDAQIVVPDTQIPMSDGSSSLVLNYSTNPSFNTEILIEFYTKQEPERYNGPSTMPLVGHTSKQMPDSETASKVGYDASATTLFQTFLQ